MQQEISVIKIPKEKNFDIKAILECGQVFRYEILNDKDKISYRVFSKDKVAYVKQFESGEAEIYTHDTKYFTHYFDLDRDYAYINRKIASYGGVMEKAARYGKGIRILRQDPEEMIFSFIISANNNIKRIQGIISRLCERVGEKTDYGYAFPSATSMANAPISLFTEVGCGYRAPYIYDTAKAISSGFDVAAIKEMPLDLARKELLKLKGIGRKVADCILLFGYGRTDVFPADTWIVKVYKNHFNGDDAPAPKVSDFFAEKFKDLSGFAQQYLFYYQRSNTPDLEEANAER